jgi:peptidyl-prolyl cis-trans isomerase A (cyclophilin A)
MKLKSTLSKTIMRVLFSCVILSSISVSATIVQFETNQGNFEVNLYDNDTPLTVANFLAYVNAGDYSNAVFHRAVPGFVLQGGGFRYDQAWPLASIAANPSVNNEPVFSNVRATIAMARLGGQPNSATNQWFINVANNTGLDSTDNGFTVFGEVVGDGMGIVDSIVNIPTSDFGGAFAEIPLQNFDPANDPDDTNLMIITSIQIVDTDVNSASGLNPVRNTSNPPTNPGDNSSGGGGSMGLLLLALLSLTSIRTRCS